MVIFNSYVKLPEGIHHPIPFMCSIDIHLSGEFMGFFFPCLISVYFPMYIPMPIFFHIFHVPSGELT